MDAMMRFRGVEFSAGRRGTAVSRRMTDILRVLFVTAKPLHVLANVLGQNLGVLLRRHAHPDPKGQLIRLRRGARYRV